MLEISGLQVSYGRVRALKGLDLNVNRGEAVGIIGRNGAGKTTTLKAIMGLVPIEGGTVTFQDELLNGAAPERISRLGVGWVPEGRRIFGTLTVEENLKVGASAVAGSEAHVDDDVLDRFPVLRRYYSSPAGGLSGGEQQQLAIARTLAGRPTLLLLDEPSLGLAPLVVDEVFRALDGLREAGMTILLVEQNASRAIEFAERCYVIRSGEIEFEGTRDELLDDSRVADAYLGVA